MEIWDANLVLKIVKFKRAALEKVLGSYVVSGKQIYVLQSIDEDLSLSATIGSAHYTISVEQKSLTMVLLDAKFVNQENTVS